MVRQVLSNAQDQVIVHNIKTSFQVIQRFNEQLGLTQDEIIIILFTSLDMDYFTNLLISQGDFTMWFNVNFEGESQGEIDFKNH